jgi:hypothetical protein
MLGGGEIRAIEYVPMLPTKTRKANSGSLKAAANDPRFTVYQL